MYWPLPAANEKQSRRDIKYARQSQSYKDMPGAKQTSTPHGTSRGTTETLGRFSHQDTHDYPGRAGGSDEGVESSIDIVDLDGEVYE